METLRQRIILEHGDITIILMGCRKPQGPVKHTLVVDCKGAPLMELESSNYNMPHNQTEKFVAELCDRGTRDLVEKIGDFNGFIGKWTQFRQWLKKRVKCCDYGVIWREYEKGLNRSYHKRQPLIEVKQKRVLCTLVRTAAKSKEISFVVHRSVNRNHFFNFQIAIEVHGRIVHTSFSRESVISDVDILEKVAIATLDTFATKYDLNEGRHQEYVLRIRAGINRIRPELVELLEVLNNNCDW